MRRYPRSLTLHVRPDSVALTLWRPLPAAGGAVRCERTPQIVKHSLAAVRKAAGVRLLQSPRRDGRLA